jgi:hypothetical protein
LSIIISIIDWENAREANLPPWTHLIYEDNDE